MAALEEDNPTTDVSGDAAPTPGGTIAEVQRMMGQAKATGPLESDTGGATTPQEPPQAPPVEKETPDTSAGQNGDSGASAPVQSSGQSSANPIESLLGNVESGAKQAASAAGNAAGAAGNAAGSALGDAWSRYSALQKAGVQFSQDVQNPLTALYQDFGQELGRDVDPNSYWQALTWAGRVLNAGLDPNAVKTSVQNIENDKSVQGQLMQNALGTNKFGGRWIWENAMPNVLTTVASLPDGVWIPMMAANSGVQNPGQIPGSLGALFPVQSMAEQIQHDPTVLTHPDFLKRAGMMALGSVMTLGMVTPAVRGLVKVVPGLAPLIEHIDANMTAKALADRGAITLEDGRVIDPVADPVNHARYAWLQDAVDSMPSIDAARSTLKGAVEPIEGRVGKAIEYPNGQIKMDFNAADKELQGVRDSVYSKLGIGEDVEDPLTQFKVDVAHGNYTPKQVKWVQDHWDDVQRALGFSYPLDYFREGEEAARNPMETLKGLPASSQSNGLKAVAAANRLISHIKGGVFGHMDNPMASLYRSLIGGTRATGYISKRYTQAILNLVPKEEMKNVTKVIENPDLYDAAAPEVKLAADLHRLIYGVHGGEAVKVGMFDETRPRYLPRVLAKAAKGLNVDGENIRAAMSRVGTYTKHRASGLTLDEGGNVMAQQRYDTVQAANAARGQAQLDLARAIVQDHPEINEAAARKMAESAIPLFTEHYGQILASDLGRRIEALHQNKAADILSHAVFTDKNGLRVPVVYKTAGENPLLDESLRELHPAEQVSHFTGQGYKALDGAQLAGDQRGALWHPDFAEPWNRVVAADRRNSSRGYKLFQTLTKAGMQLVMFDPMWHAWNIAGRAMDFSVGNGRQVFKQIMENGRVGLPINGKFKGIKWSDLSHDELDQLWEDQKFRAYQHGLVPHYSRLDPMNEYGKVFSHATGDSEVGSPMGGLVADPKVGQDPNVLQRAINPWNHVQDWFWQRYEDFAVNAFLAEEQNALKFGKLDPASAGFYAAGRANAWKGAIAPEQWAKSPMLHSASQFLMFAPNWWRSYGQLLAGTYMSHGIAKNRAMANLWAVNEMKTLGGMWAANMATSNILNYLMSGHLQYDNQPGNKLGIEMDRFYPPDPTTGAHHVMEDPTVRQEKDTLTALGMSERPDEMAVEKLMGKPMGEQTAPGAGLGQVAIARMGLVPSMLQMATNLNWYESAKKRAPVWYDPLHPGLFASGSAMAAAPTALTSMGLPIQQAMQQNAAPPPVFKGGPQQNDTLAQTLMSFGGVRGPYENPEKTQGRGLGSEEQLEVDKAQNQYEANLLQAEHTAQQSGDLNTFLNTYYSLSHDHAVYMNAKYQDIASVSGGARGIQAAWNDIYSQKGVVDPNGDINYPLLSDKRAQLKAKVLAQPGGADEWSHFEALQSQEELKHPILKVWNDTLTEYHGFQDQFAVQHGINGDQFRRLLQQYHEAPVPQQFEAQHPELRGYTAAKRQWETSSRAGTLYGLFTNDRYIDSLVMARMGQNALPAFSQQQLSSAVDLEKQALAAKGQSFEEPQNGSNS